MANRSIDPNSIYVLPELTVQILRRMTPVERIGVACELNRNVRNRLAAKIASANPSWSEAQMRAELARRMLAGEFNEDD